MTVSKWDLRFRDLFESFSACHALLGYSTTDCFVGDSPLGHVFLPLTALSVQSPWFRRRSKNEVPFQDFWLHNYWKEHKFFYLPFWTDFNETWRQSQFEEQGEPFQRARARSCITNTDARYFIWLTIPLWINNAPLNTEMRRPN